MRSANVLKGAGDSEKVGDGLGGEKRSKWALD